jgi:hypothetical protein
LSSSSKKIGYDVLLSQLPRNSASARQLLKNLYLYQQRHFHKNDGYMYGNQKGSNVFTIQYKSNNQVWDVDYILAPSILRTYVTNI